MVNIFKFIFKKRSKNQHKTGFENLNMEYLEKKIGNDLYLIKYGVYLDKTMKNII